MVDFLSNAYLSSQTEMKVTEGVTNLDLGAFGTRFCDWETSVPSKRCMGLPKAYISFKCALGSVYVWLFLGMSGLGGAMNL